MNPFIKSLVNRKSRLPVLIIYITLFIIVAGLATALALMNFRRDYLESYKELQQQRTNVLAMGLEGRTEDEMKEYLAECVPSSASTFAFLETNKEVIFLQSAYTTDNMTTLKDPVAFEEYLSSQDATITSALSPDEKYTVGIITSNTYAYEASEFDTFVMYIVIIFSVALLFLGGCLIFVSGLLTSHEDKYDNIETELNERNEAIEKIQQQVQIQEDAQRLKAFHDQPQQQAVTLQGPFYDSNILNALLDKSADAALMPMTFLFMQVMMTDRYFTKNEILKPAFAIKEALPDQCVLIEIARAHFIIICYTVDDKEIVPLQARLEAVWNEKKADGDVEIRFIPRTLQIYDKPHEAFVKYNGEVWTS